MYCEIVIEAITLSHHMANHRLLRTVSSLFVLSQALMGRKDSANSGSWSGVIVNSDCTVDEGLLGL